MERLYGVEDHPGHEDLPGRLVGPRAARNAARNPARAVVLGIAMVAALAGCSGAAATPAPSAPPPPTATVAVTQATAAPTATPASLATMTPLPDPCKLLTQDEADALAGVKLGVALPEGIPPTNCVWPAPLTGSVAQVEVGVGDGAKKFLDIDKDTLGHDFAQVPGIGDEAWQESDTVFVRTGTLWFSLHLVKLDTDPNAQSNMQTLAKTILGRIGK